MNEDKRRSEQARREAAQREAGQVEVTPVGEVHPRELRHMLSVRMETALVRGLRQVAESRGVRVSDLLREAAAQLVEEYRHQHVSVKLTGSPERSEGGPKLTVVYGAQDAGRDYGARALESYGVAVSAR